MRVHEFTVVPIEVGYQALEKIQERVKGHSSFGKHHNLGDFEFSVYPIHGVAVSKQYETPRVLVCMVGSSLCIVLYGITSEIGSPEAIASAIKGRRKRVEEGLKRPNSQDFQLEAIYDILGGTADWGQSHPSYAFSFYVIEIPETGEPFETQIQGEGNPIYSLAHALAHSRSEDSEVLTTEAIDRNLLGESGSSKNLPYLTSYWNIAGLSTWSSFVLVASKKATGEAVNLALDAELTLQTAWNRCSFLTARAEDLLNKDPSGFDPQQHLRTILAARQISKRALTPTVSGRKRDLLDYLVKTSRVEDEIESLSQVIELLNHEVEKRQDRRRITGQGYITTILAFLAGVGVAQPLADSFGRSLLSGAIGLVFAGLTYLIIRRTKY